MSDFTYVGSELDLFAVVHHWKSYWSSRIRRYIGGDILEVGAGIGSNTAYLDPGSRGRFVCLEPDRTLIEQLQEHVGNTSRSYETICGSLETMSSREQFDTIIYIDVLEHIEDDRAELARAVGHLRPGGRIIVLSPAHQWLFTPFDAAIGHFRRYTRTMLKSISPDGVFVDACFYLDAVGMFASAANRLFLKQSMPTKEQLRFWDTYIVPVSRVVDPCLGFSVGKSVVGVWRKRA